MKIAIMGHGVVGSGVVELLKLNSDFIKQKAGESIEVKKILDLKDFSELDYADKFTKDFNDILNDDEISIVAETMGGLNVAYKFVKECLEHKKSVVTSNKELVATKGAELISIAQKNNINFLFEASVGGGIPIIKPLHLCLGANEIVEIAGILNGTTNFILTKMIDDDISFDDGLKLAQNLGYAEKDPTADIEGYDACRKICILSSLAFGKHIYPENVHCEGITGISLEDVDNAKKMGGVIKLIGRAKPTSDNKLEIMVSPSIIMNDSQLASVKDVFNAVLVRGNATGDVMFYGKGAGKLPTASAVVSDIIDIVRAKDNIDTLSWKDSNENNIVPYTDVVSDFYINILNPELKDIFDFFANCSIISTNENRQALVLKNTTLKNIKETEEKLNNIGIKILNKLNILNY